MSRQTSLLLSLLCGGATCALMAGCGLGFAKITYDDGKYDDALEYRDLLTGETCVPDAETFQSGNGDQGGDTAQGVPTTNPDEDRRGGEDRAHGKDTGSTVYAETETGRSTDGESQRGSGSATGSGSGSGSGSATGSGSGSGSGSATGSGSGSGSDSASGGASSSGSVGMGCDAYNCCSVSDDAEMDLDRDRDRIRCRCRERLWNGEEWVLPECCELEDVELPSESDDDMPPPPPPPPAEPGM